MGMPVSSPYPYLGCGEIENRYRAAVIKHRRASLKVVAKLEAPPTGPKLPLKNGPPDSD